MWILSCVKDSFQTFSPPFSPSHIPSLQLSPSVSKALQVLRKVVALSLPAELLDTASKLAQGKVGMAAGREEGRGEGRR